MQLNNVSNYDIFSLYITGPHEIPYWVLHHHYTCYTPKNYRIYIFISWMAVLILPETRRDVAVDILSQHTPGIA